MNWPGEGILNKLIDIFGGGTTGLLRPWQELRVGKSINNVKADEIIKTAAAEKIAEEIRSGRMTLDTGGNPVQIKSVSSSDSQKVLPEATSNDDVANDRQLFDDAATRLKLKELKREVNLRQIAMATAEEAINIPQEEISNEPVNPDWITQWQNRAQDVSDKDIQRLFAKILTGEVKQPNSFSFHTLDFLSKLTKKDAQIIALIGDFLISSQGMSFIFDPDLTFLPKKGLPFEIIMDLEEQGIISTGAGLLQIKWIGEPEKDVKCSCVYGEKYIHFTKSPPENKIILKQLWFTRIGQELMKLKDIKVDQGYLNNFIKHLKDKGCDVYVGDFIRYKSDDRRQVEYKNMQQA